MPRKERTKDSTMLAKSFGKRLRTLREERSLSQRDLAKGVGSETAHISRYERGVVTPNADSLLDLAKFLRVDVGFLLTGETGAEGGKEDLPVNDLSLLERFRELEKLDRKDREVVIAVIDAFLTAREFEQVSAKRTQRAI